MKYERLFTPVKLGTLTLKNRIVMMAMHHLYTEGGLPTDRFCNYYFKRAEGGAAMVIVGACRFDDYGSKAHTMSLQKDEYIAPWQTFTNGMHQRGCLAAVQLYHAGRYMPKKDAPAGRAIAPSATLSSYTGEVAEEMTLAEIRQVTADYAAAALRAKKAGFDAVEISGAVGYLISQFLSPLTNLRTDDYGGAWENRCRFPLEVIGAVRASVGPDYPLILKMSGSDLVEGSLREPELTQFAVLAEAAGVDCLDVTGGWHETKVPQLPTEDPRGGQVFLAQNIHEAVKIPVMGGIRINRPETAEALLAMDMCDIIGMGRPLIADPELPNKARAENEALIRTCMACNQGCLARTFFDRPVECLVNGLAGREYRMDPEAPTFPAKHILVAGGGPAGCEFAIRAAHRGHKVTLMEASDHLGGCLALASAMQTKYEFKALIAYYEAALKKEGVTVLLNKKAAPGDAAGFDEVVLAFGAPFARPEVETDGSVAVCTVEDVLLQRVVPGRRVVVYGGNFIGCEAARYLAKAASLSADQLFYLTVYKVTAPENISHMLSTSRRTVVIAEPGPKTGLGYEQGTGWPTFADHKRLGVTQKKNSRLIGVKNGCAVLEGPEGMAEIPCDTLVLNPDREPDELRLAAFLALDKPVHVIGDAKTPSSAMYGIRDAAALGIGI